MLVERIEARWIAAFVDVLRRCAIVPGDVVAVLSESQSRRVLVDLAEIAEALGIDPGRVVDAQWGDNGPGWVMVLLADAEAVLALRPDGRLMTRFSDIGVAGPHPVGSEVAYEVRAFWSPGPSEDPVTGSLNAALGQWLTSTGRAPSSYVAAQGTALGRRGRAYVDRVGDDLWVGGDTVVGVQGTVALR